VLTDGTESGCNEQKHHKRKNGGYIVARIQELVAGKGDRLPTDAILAAQPWLLRRGMKCILSPDSDGLLCALLMAQLLDWEIVGFYDGKVALIREGVSCYAEDTAFLDMEVFRAGVRSIGHHMVRYSATATPQGWGNYSHCIQPNNLRGYAKNPTFRLKYPLATIHLLLALLGRRFSIKLPETAVTPLLFTDGTFNVIYGYPENVLDWLRYLQIDDAENPLRSVFLNTHHTMYSTMVAMDDFFRRRDRLSVPNERGDRLRISRPDGTPTNVEYAADGTVEISLDARGRILEFLAILGELTGWAVNEGQWAFDRLRLFQFEKSSFSSDGLNLNGANYNALLARRPLTWAITSGLELEYTLENPSTLP
jgi:hypothetical protein